MRTLKQVPRFREPLRSVRLAWIVGGWIRGWLLVDDEGIRLVPGRTGRAVFRAPELSLHWDEVTHAAVHELGWPRGRGIVEVGLVDGPTCGFGIARTTALAAVLERQRVAPSLEPQPA